MGITEKTIRAAALFWIAIVLALVGGGLCAESANADAEAAPSGGPIASLQKPSDYLLYPGWNLIAAGESASIERFATSLNCPVSVIWGWAPEGQGWGTFGGWRAYFPSMPSWPISTLPVVMPGRAYWVHCGKG